MLFRLSLISITIFGFFFFVPPALASVFNSVPFTSQAPFGDWSWPWQDACEEASIVMVDHFYAGKSLSPSVAKDQISRLFRIKEGKFGASLDENAKLIANIINLFYPWEAYIVDRPRLDEIKQELALGRPVILPAHGTALGNQFFRTPQLDYHVIVLSGYDDLTGEFITQDPGTQHGLDFRYSFATIMNAMHDYVPGVNATKDGPSVAIFTRKNLIDSGLTDGDSDGLVKQEEIIHGTVLWLQDSDGDGYSDGNEVQYGYYPRLDEHGLIAGTLVKTMYDPKVYKLETTFLGEKQKRHIANEAAFLRRNWRWEDIVIVSERFLDNTAKGKILE